MHTHIHRLVLITQTTTATLSRLHFITATQTGATSQYSLLQTLSSWTAAKVVMSPTKRKAQEEEDDGSVDHTSSVKQFKEHVSAYAATPTTNGSGSHSNTATTTTTTKVVVKAEDEHNGPIVTRNVLMWFRNDLRIRDNKALYTASMRSKIGGTGNNHFLIALYIISEEEWAEHDEAPVKIDFWMRNLVTLKTSLDKLAIPLVIKTAKKKTDVVKVVEKVVEDMDVSHVFWSQELMVDERKRDRVVREALVKKHPGVYVEEHEDQLVVPAEDVRTKVRRLDAVVLS